MGQIQVIDHRNHVRCILPIDISHVVFLRHTLLREIITSYITPPVWLIARNYKCYLYIYAVYVTMNCLHRIPPSVNDENKYSWGPFYKHGLVPAWISNHMVSKCWIKLLNHSHTLQLMWLLIHVCEDTLLHFITYAWLEFHACGFNAKSFYWKQASYSARQGWLIEIRGVWTVHT